MSEDVVKRHKRRVWFFVGGAVVVMLLVLFAAYFWDESLEDHSDLVPEKLVTTGGDRVYHMWVNEVFPLVDKEAWRAFERDARDPDTGDRDWTGEAARTLLQASEGLLEAVFRADREGAWVFPQMVPGRGRKSFGADAKYVADRLKLLAILNADSGDFRGAAKAAAAGLRFWDRQTVSKGIVIDLVVGTGCAEAAGEAVDRLCRPGVPDSVLKDLEAVLGDEPDFVAAMTHALKAEFSLLPDALDRWDEDVRHIEILDPPPGFLLKNNATLNRVADDYRLLIAELNLAPVRRASHTKTIEDVEGWRRYAPNACGHWMRSGLEVFSKAVDAMEKNLELRRLRRCRVALIRFEKAEGRLPDSLEELVPWFLDAVPVDVYDGKPIRYDAERGAVWGLGGNLKDDGGAAVFDPDKPTGDKDNPTIFVHGDAPWMNPQ